MKTHARKRRERWLQAEEDFNEAIRQRDEALEKLETKQRIIDELHEQARQEMLRLHDRIKELEEENIRMRKDADSLVLTLEANSKARHFTIAKTEARNKARWWREKYGKTD